MLCIAACVERGEGLRPIDVVKRRTAVGQLPPRATGSFVASPRQGRLVYCHKAKSIAEVARYWHRIDIRNWRTSGCQFAKSKP